jgi:acyl-CoA thioesterase II
MSAAMQELLSILDLEELELNLFRGRSPAHSMKRVYGGQVIAQALVAAQRTVDSARFVHSLHCYFILPGNPAIPIVYEVERLRDGGSFTTRRVTAIQRGAAIFSLEASFQVEEPGLTHQLPMPLDLPAPETLKSRPVVVAHYTTREKLPPEQYNWIRLTGPVSGDRLTETALLGYLSDMTLLDTSTLAHGRALFEPEIQAASLDHAMWFHRSHKLDDWLLYVQDSPSSSGARGFNRGALYGRDGTLIASVAQEGLIRLRTRPSV